MSKTEQFVLVLFLSVLITVVPETYVYGQEVEAVPSVVESGDQIQADESPAVHSEVAEPEVTTEEPQRDTVASTTEEILVPIDETAASSEEREEDPVELVEVSQITLPLQTISQTIASSSLNESLPFSLVTERMNFAINEVPVFTFSYRTDTPKGVIETFVAEMYTDIKETVIDLYEDSFVEAIVEVVSDTVTSVVDFFIPTAEGQEVVQDGIGEDIVPVEPVTSIAAQFTTDIDVAQIASTTETESATSSRADIVRDDVVVSATTSTSTQTSFAVVDGIRYPVYITYTEDETFVVDMQSAVFGVGVHTLQLPVLFQEKMYVAYYTFSVDGTVLSTRPLKEGIFAVVIADADAFQTLWLIEQSERGVQSIQKIADETTMSQNPVLEFNDDTLFWTSPTKETLIGFDIVSRTSFSQTLNLKSRDENILKLQLGSYDVSVSPEDIDVTHRPNTP
jgi:hypothetical protein